MAAPAPKERKRATVVQASAITEDDAKLVYYEHLAYRHTVDPVQGCWPATLTPSSTGYVSVTYKGRQYYAHALMLALVQRYPTRSRFPCDASHLCGLAVCINPEHLVWEPRWINETRKACHLYGPSDPGHRCPHSPSCVYTYGQ